MYSEKEELLYDYSYTAGVYYTTLGNRVTINRTGETKLRKQFQEKDCKT